MEEINVDQLIKKQESLNEASLKTLNAQSDGLLINTDQAYFDAYFNICRMYQEKRYVLEQNKKFESDRLRQKPMALADRKPLVGRSGKLLAKSRAYQRKILGMNNKIKKTEASFWGCVEKAQKAGVKFVFEEIASRFNLKRYEKRVLLFFFYLEYHDITSNVCMEDDLLLLFDLDSSALCRMSNYKYFSSDAALFSNSLLTSENYKGSDSARMEVLLTNKALGILSDGLNGDKSEVQEREKSSSSDFDSVGYVKEPDYTLDDVMLKDEVKDKVKLFLDAYRDKKLDAIGVKERIKKGLGAVFLFYGPPGTGKSMLAEAMGQYVNKKILMVEYPKIMERWVGATDKNISNIFKVAEKEDLVIVLDEADTLFYSRSFAYQEHDIRFVNEMLQELERFKGMIILTTNMDNLLDQALERRVSLKIKFEHPTKEARSRIWHSHLPKELKLSEDVDFNLLANKYEFSGGNIKNAVLNALRKMISQNSDTLFMKDLIFGADMEQEGMFSSQHKRQIGFITN